MSHTIPSHSSPRWLKTFEGHLVDNITCNFIASYGIKTQQIQDCNQFYDRNDKHGVWHGGSGPFKHSVWTRNSELGRIQSICYIYGDVVTCTTLKSHTCLFPLFTVRGHCIVLNIRSSTSRSVHCLRSCLPSVTEIVRCMPGRTGLNGGNGVVWLQCRYKCNCTTLLLSVPQPSHRGAACSWVDFISVTYSTCQSIVWVSEIVMPLVNFRVKVFVSIYAHIQQAGVCAARNG